MKDGRSVTLRLLQKEDANRLYEMFSSMSKETLQWDMPPYTMETIERWMASYDRLIPVVAVVDDRIVGYSAIFKYLHSRRKGGGDMGIYLHQDYHSIGLGTAMTKMVLRLAKEQRLHRLTLQVVEDNKIAVKLYKKFGFEVEGKMRDAFLGEDDRYHAVLVMGKILE